MHARVTRFQILHGKIDEFAKAAESLLPLMRQQKGFCGVFVLQTHEADPIEVQVLSFWKTLEDLNASEKNLYFYQALARVQAFAHGFPSIHVHHVLAGEFEQPFLERPHGAS
ncbi:MAG TPA: antibiotic biosynthesis monooxygenase [Candidatus Acidoferrales bacterium]|nr:antibiotic biosynthesis monooxygenase [Candidatus Acidoferrales bacterium]